MKDRVRLDNSGKRLQSCITHTYLKSIYCLINLVESKDPFTKGHSHRVARLGVLTAKKLGLLRADLDVLYYTCKMHDLGKIAISAKILNKRGSLTHKERTIIELHPSKGEEILKFLRFIKPGLSLIRHHHERYDGYGYPDKLSKNSIPLMARIISCCDAFDAMISHRVYRLRPFSYREAIHELEYNAGGQFDPKVVKAFISVIRPF